MLDRIRYYSFVVPRGLSYPWRAPITAHTDTPPTRMAVFMKLVIVRNLWYAMRNFGWEYLAAMQMWDYRCSERYVEAIKYGKWRHVRSVIMRRK